jgi:putative MATE family efflux protein
MLTSGPIGPMLVRLSLPMLVGIVAMMAFNVVDTFFVGRLGTLPLAAMTLTFPVVMVIGTFALGLGIGAMVAVSQSIGAGDESRIRRYTTDALTLAALCVIILSGIGLATIEPLFRLLGATDEMMPFVRQYMLIWYPGMVFYIVPVVGNNIIRATGDTLTPSIIMLVSIAINAVLDPLLIFGLGPIPALGVAGAAIATVVSRALTLAVALGVLHFHQRLLAFPWPGRRTLVESWRIILRIGLPVAVSNIVIPIALGVVTRIVTRFGAEAVAGFGVATRIESFGLALIYALSAGVSPFVGQNFGAGRMDRVRKGLDYAKAFSLGWGILLLVVFLLFGRRLVSSFDPDPAAIRAASLYLWIISISLGLRSVHQVTWTALNVLGRPYESLFLEFLLAFGLWIPLALIGAHVAELAGVFGGLSLANLLAGAVAYVWIDRVVRRKR